MYYAPLIIVHYETDMKAFIDLYDRWGLMPLARPWFAPPPVKTDVVEVPGASGVVDLSEALTGAPVYGNRTGEWNFLVDRTKNKKAWNETYSDIMNTIHGRSLKVSLEDEQDWYYEGRFSVSSYTSYTDGSGQGYTISYDVGPYKTNFKTGEKSL